MEAKSLMDALILCRRFDHLLNEVIDLSQQLAAAADRGDQVSVEMLTAMRREPIEQLLKTKQEQRLQVESLRPPDDALRLAQLLNGMPAQEPEEQKLADQVAANARRLQQALELDKIVNRKLTREKTIYQQDRIGT